jgi:hypothetical protein
LVIISTAADLHHQARQHLASQAEAAGFFLADYRAESGQFRLRQWRPVPAAGFESRSDFHLVLADDFRAEIIKWAWDSDVPTVRDFTAEVAERLPAAAGRAVPRSR